MADKNLTVFQRLGRVLGGESSSPTYVIDPKSFANLNPQETEQKKLEAQQTFFLQNQWKKIDNELYQKAVYYEPTRIASYYDYEAMEYSIIGATKIATPDGFITIKELADKGRDYEFITYAYDHNLKKVVPAMARNAHYTRDEMTYKITFDDNSFIIATYGHRFLKRDGVFEILENLKPGDSMMPFYRKSFYNNEKYNWVYTCNNEEGHNGWVAEHTLVAEWFYNQKLKENEEVHHIDFNGKNNNPENLKIWDISEHRAYHARLNNEKLWSNPDYRAKMLEISKRTDNKHNWNGERSGENNPAYIKIDFNTIINVAKEKRTIELTAKHLGVSYRKIQNELRFNGFKNWDNFLSVYKIKKYRPISENFESINFKLIPWDLLVDTAKEEKLMLKVCVKLNITLGKLRSTLRQGGYNNWKTFTDAYGITMGKTGRKKQGVMTVNHKIVSIEPHGIMPVYDLTVPGYKNFATDTIFSHNTPEIAVALDIFSDEATTASESGKILTIFSESTRIKNELTDLFENVLDINTNLNSWARNLCKYGDNFVYLKIVPKKGVIGCTQLPNVEVTRSEPGFNFVTSQDALQKERVSKFFWKDKNIEFNSFEVAHFRLLGDDRKLPYGTSILEKVRRIWKQLLLSEDAMLVYRVTRAPERRVYKIFVGNMDDKDIDPYVDKIANNFKRVNMVNSNNGQTDTRYNPLAVDQDYFIPVRDPALTMPIETLPGACIALDTKIPLLDGRVLSLQEIINEWDGGNRNLWVYSCNPKTGAPEPGMVTWAGVTRKNTQVMKITLDNGEEVVTTPDHKFVHRTNGFVEAQHLNVGDSLMPFYTKTEKIKKNTNDYHQIWDNEKQEWVYTHRMVKNSIVGKSLVNEWVYDKSLNNKDKKIIHHKDCNRFNNTPDNLLIMNGEDHLRYHQSIIKEYLWSTPEKAKINKEKISKGVKTYLKNLSPEELTKRHNRINNPNTKAKTTKKLLGWNKDENNLIEKGKIISNVYTDDRKENLSVLSKELWTIDGYKEKVFSKKQTITFGDEIYNHFLSVFETNLRADKTLEILNADTTFIEKFKLLNHDIRSSLTNLDEFTLNHLNKMVKERGFNNFSDWKKSECDKRGYINQRQWKYNVDKGIYYNHKIVNIEYLDNLIDTGTLTIDGNENYSNSHTFAILLPVQIDGVTHYKSGIYIKNSNLSEIADIEYIQKKMLAALRVPKAFLGFDEATGEGKNLAILDIRFARAVHRIQKALIQELNKIAIIHLYTKGYEDDLNNFTLQLTTPSTQADILKVQNWKEKITLYKDAVSDAGNGFAAVSMTWAKKEILGMSEEDIKLDIQRQAVEKAGGEELKMIGETIKQTGLFREIYKAYKINPDNMSTPGGVTGGEQPQPGGGGGSSSVGMDFTTPLEPGAPGAEAGGIPGAEPGVPGAEGAETPEAELGGTTPEEKNDLSEIARRNLDKRRISLNESITKTIKDIDDLLKD